MNVRGMYGVEIGSDQFDQRVYVLWRDRFDALLKVVDVSIQRVDVELDRRELVDTGRSDPERLLQAL